MYHKEAAIKDSLLHAYGVRIFYDAVLYTSAERHHPQLKFIAWK
jgi:hypothetical protein